MTIQLKRFGLALSSAGLLVAAGCGGGSDSTPATPVATTTNVSTTVVDGAIKNAVVCLDRNSNGKCDTDEV